MKIAIATLASLLMASSASALIISLEPTDMGTWHAGETDVEVAVRFTWETGDLPAEDWSLVIGGSFYNGATWLDADGYEASNVETSLGRLHVVGGRTTADPFNPDNPEAVIGFGYLDLGVGSASGSVVVINANVSMMGTPIEYTSVSTPPIGEALAPEPGTAALMGLGLAGLAWGGRRRV